MDLWLLAGFVACILVLGFFNGMESAFGASGRIAMGLRTMDRSRLSGRILSGYLDKPNRLIGSSLVVINLLLVGCGILVTETLRPFWEHLLSGALNTPLVKLLVETLAATLILIVLGWLIPRAVFRSRPESLLAGFIIPESLVLEILYPVFALFVTVSEGIITFLFNARPGDKRPVFMRVAAELYLSQDTPSQADNQDLNAELLQNALSLPYVKVRECMVPRNEIEALEVSCTLADAIQKFGETQLSKLLIYEGSLDNILGYLHHLDMFRQPQDLRAILHPVVPVPETMSAIDLMNRFTKGRRSIAWVVDEFGGTAGMVTMEDLLEEIFGEIKDEHDTEDLVEKQAGENEWIFSGRLEIDYLNEKYKFGFPETGNETLSGFIITHHETIPRLKERILIRDFEFDILAVTETRIEQVKMKWLK